MDFVEFGPDKLWWISRLNLLGEVRGDMSLPQRITIKDETLREGCETPGVFLKLSSKLQIASKIQELGVKEIELGYAGASDEDANTFKAFKAEGIDLKLSSHVRTYVKDWRSEIDRAIDAGADIINLLMHTDASILRSRGINADKLSRLSQECIEYSKDRGSFTIFGCDATRANFHLLEKIYTTAASAKPQRIWVYDGVGCALPSASRYLIKKVREWAGDIPIGVHFHNDFGLATANTLASIEAGAEACDVVINGLGDRAGNASLEEVAMSLTVQYGVDIGLNLSILYEMSQLVQELTGVRIPPNKAVVGENAFTHQTDSHIYAILKEGSHTYENFQPQLVGQQRRLLFSATTLHGPALEIALKGEGIHLSEEQMKKLIQSVHRKCQQKKYLTLSELVDIARAIIIK